jgi:hypothetical protein
VSRSVSQKRPYIMKAFYTFNILILVLTVLFGPGAYSDPERFNYILGTHSIGSYYQLTDKTRLIETAEVPSTV